MKSYVCLGLKEKIVYIIYAYITSGLIAYYRCFHWYLFTGTFMGKVFPLLLTLSPNSVCVNLCHSTLNLNVTRGPVEENRTSYSSGL